MSWKPEVDEIKKRRELALARGGADAIAGNTVRTAQPFVSVSISFSTRVVEELGPVAGTPVLNEAGELVSYDPANFILGWQSEWPSCHCRRRRFHDARWLARLRVSKSVYAEDLAVQYKVP